MQPVADLEAAHRGVDIGIEHLPVAGIGFEIAGDRQPRAQRRHRRALGADLQAARPAALRGQPPLATMASYCAIELCVVSAVEGDNVGSDFFGSLTLREALSKPLPIPFS